MLPYLSLHTLAAPRGEGLRPEFVELFKRLSGVPEAALISAENRHEHASSLQASVPHKRAKLALPEGTFIGRTL